MGGGVGKGDLIAHVNAVVHIYFLFFPTKKTSMLRESLRTSGMMLLWGSEAPQTSETICPFRANKVRYLAAKCVSVNGILSFIRPSRG